MYTKVYHKDGTEVDLGKNSLPIGGKYEKVRRVVVAAVIDHEKHGTKWRNLVQLERNL